jgi:hypothetical protein
MLSTYCVCPAFTTTVSPGSGKRPALVGHQAQPPNANPLHAAKVGSAIKRRGAMERLTESEMILREMNDRLGIVLHIGQQLIVCLRRRKAGKRGNFGFGGGR